MNLGGLGSQELAGIQVTERENASKDSAVHSWGRVDRLGQWSTLWKSMHMKSEYNALIINDGCFCLNNFTITVQFSKA